MHIRELTNEEFNNFINNNDYNSIYQTVEYALTMNNQGYDSILIGFVDNDNIIAASIILIETKYGFKYAYAPRGIMIDYNNEKLLKIFTWHLKKYLSSKEITAIKINPMITKNIFNSKKELIYHNEDYNKIYLNLKSLGYFHLGYNNNFESFRPRFEAVIDLDKPIDKLFYNIKKSFRTKIRQAQSSGITIHKGTKNNLENLYFHTKKKYPRGLDYFNQVYKYFSKENKVNLFYTKLDTEKYLINIKNQYDKQEDVNSNINNEIMKYDNNIKLINRKMEEDKRFALLEKKLVSATNLLREHPEGIITSSLLIATNKDQVYLLIDGHDKNYQYLNSKHLLLWTIIEKYSSLGYTKFNLGGVTNILNDNQKYNGLNEFKLNFDANVIEYIGDLELICHAPLYFMYKNTIQFKNIIKNSRT